MWFQVLKLNDVPTFTRQPQTLVLQDAIAIAKQVPSVREVAPQITANQLITYRNSNANEQVIGTTPEYLTVRSFEVDSGTIFSALLMSNDIKEL